MDNSKVVNFAMSTDDNIIERQEKIKFLIALHKRITLTLKIEKNMIVVSKFVICNLNLSMKKPVSN